MSNLSIYLLLVFVLLFTIENKPINTLLYFIGMILSLSVYIFNISNIDISLISYMLMIIYGSAIVILFGFIIMLYHYSKNFIPTSILNIFFTNKPKEIIYSFINKVNITPWKRIITKIVYIIILTTLIYYIYINKIYIENIKDTIGIYREINIERTKIIEKIYEVVFNKEESWIIITITINILLLIMIGIIYIYTI